MLAGAGTVYDNQIMGKGNYGLASHYTNNEKLLFTPLLKVKPSENIYLMDFDNIYSYKILQVKEVNPEEVNWLYEVENKKLVTLVTCGQIEGINRIIVQGELKNITPIEEASDKTLAYFEN